MLKKLVCFLLALCCSLALFAGCTKPSDGGSVDPDKLDLNIDSNIKETLRVAIMNEPGEIATINELEKGFKKLYPNVTIKVQKITNYEQSIQGDVAAGVVYDVMWVSDQYVSLFADSGLLESLDPFIEKSGFDTSLYYDSVIKLGQKNHNGAQYFMPRDINKMVVYLNKKIFAQHNVELPDNDWTWSDFLDVCKKLYDNGCNYNTSKQQAVEVDFDWRILMYSFSKSFGGTIINEKGEAVLDEQFQMGLKEMHKLIENGYAQYSPGVQQNFVSGRTAMRFQVRPYAQSYYASLGEDLEAVAFPKIISGIDGTSPSCGAGTTGYGISKASTKKVLAWKFLEYMMSEEGQNTISKSGTIVPSLKSLAEDENAVWRTIIPINSDAFVYSGTTDVIYDFYDMLDSVMMSGYDGAIQNMLTNYFSKANGDPKGLISTCKRDIANFVRDQG